MSSALRYPLFLGILVMALSGCGTAFKPSASSASDAGRLSKIDSSAEDMSAEDAASDATPAHVFPHDFTDAALASAGNGVPDAAACDAGPTANGIGLTCTRGGRQCRQGLQCTADFIGQTGLCTILGCGGGSADCGPGAQCCTLLSAGGASLCLPIACIPNSCLEGYDAGG
jgi:hypothetical protein